MLKDQFQESHDKQRIEEQIPKQRMAPNGVSTATRDQHLNSNVRATMHQQGPGTVQAQKGVRATMPQLRPGNVQEGTEKIGNLAESKPNVKVYQVGGASA